MRAGCSYSRSTVCGTSAYISGVIYIVRVLYIPLVAGKEGFLGILFYPVEPEMPFTDAGGLVALVAEE